MKKGFKNIKILIAGVGGQGIVYLTNIIAEAAMLTNIPVHVSEIHGLSQRGGVVTAGIGLGMHSTGFIGKSNIDILFGLEPLETLRCISHLHRNSSVIFGNNRIAPYSVNAQISQYPDINEFVDYLSAQCKEVIFINHFPKNIDAVLYNVYLLGRSTRMKIFPFNKTTIEAAIINTVADYHKEKTLEAFRQGINQIAKACQE